MRNIYTQMDKKDPLLVLSDKSVSQAPAAHVIAVLEVKHDACHNRSRGQVKKHIWKCKSCLTALVFPTVN